MKTTSRTTAWRGPSLLDLSRILEFRRPGNNTYECLWDLRYIDAPIVRWKDGNADGDLLDAGDPIEYFTNDANMNVTALIAQSGSVTERYRYDPYGRATVLDADWSDDDDGLPDTYNHFQHQGTWVSSTTGLHTVRYRIGHPTFGRWMQRDPAVHGRPAAASDDAILGWLRGISTGRSHSLPEMSAMAVNMYMYAEGRPTSQRDPSGLVPGVFLPYGIRGCVPPRGGAQVFGRCSYNVCPGTGRTALGPMKVGPCGCSSALTSPACPKKRSVPHCCSLFSGRKRDYDTCHQCCLEMAAGGYLQAGESILKVCFDRCADNY